MLDLRGADAKCQRPKCPVGRGMGISTHHGHAWQGRAFFRTDDMHNPLANIVHLEFRNTEGLAIRIKGFDLQSGNRIGNAPGSISGRYIVIWHGQVGPHPPGFPVGQTQAFECLW